MKPRIQNAALAASIMARESLHNALSRIENMSFVPRVSDGNHERISEFNADLATEAFFSNPLTDYAVGYNDMADLDAELEFFAPGVEVTPRFEYSVADNAEQFLSDGDDDERPSKSDFKEVEYTDSKVNAATVNRGLQITLDMDKIRGRSDWEEYYTRKLLRRIKRNQHRRRAGERGAEEGLRGGRQGLRAGVPLHRGQDLQRRDRGRKHHRLPEPRLITGPADPIPNPDEPCQTHPHPFSRLHRPEALQARQRPCWQRQRPEGLPRLRCPSWPRQAREVHRPRPEA